jgi:tRNA(Met) C34 N-acetyltransferase TmcA
MIFKGGFSVKSAKELFSTIALREGIRYIEKDPIENLPKLIDWADKLTTRENEKRKVKIIKDIVDDPSNNWNNLINRIFTELDQMFREKHLLISL